MYKKVFDLNIASFFILFIVPFFKLGFLLNFLLTVVFLTVNFFVVLNYLTVKYNNIEQNYINYKFALALFYILIFIIDLILFFINFWPIAIIRMIIIIVGIRYINNTKVNFFYDITNEKIRRGVYNDKN